MTVLSKYRAHGLWASLLFSLQPSGDVWIFWALPCPVIVTFGDRKIYQSGKIAVRSSVWMPATFESDESNPVDIKCDSLLREGKERKLHSAERKISGWASTEGGLLKGSYGNNIIVLSKFFYISFVMEVRDYHHVLLLYVIRFIDTDLSLYLLIHFSVIEVKLKEVVTVTSVRYSCKTLKTSKTKDVIVLVERDELTPYGEQNLQGITAG